MPFNIKALCFHTVTFNTIASGSHGKEVKSLDAEESCTYSTYRTADTNDATNEY